MGVGSQGLAFLEEIEGEATYFYLFLSSEMKCFSVSLVESAE